MSITFDRVPQLGACADLEADISAWIVAEPMAALITAFGGDPRVLNDAGTELPAKLTWLNEFTDQWEQAARTDPETGALLERNEARELVLTAEQSELVLAAADALGLREVARPRHTSYDYVFILGGLLRACICRPAHAAMRSRPAEWCKRRPRVIRFCRLSGQFLGLAALVV